MSVIELPPRMPVGFRFCPTEEELIRVYLEPKLQGKHSEVDHVVAEVDFCEFEPWELPFKSKIKSEDKVWFFFCQQKIKSEPLKKKAETDPWKITGKRSTKTGHWKITGEKSDVKDRETNECIAKKRNVTFQERTGEKTNWVMQEYYIVPDNPIPNQSTYVLCRVKIKPNKEAKTQKRKAGKPNKEAKTPKPKAGKPNKEAKTPKPKAGKPSGNTNTLEVENPVTPAASSWAHGHEEVNQESLSQPLDFTEEHPEDIVNGLIADSDAKFCWNTAYSPLNDCSPQTSLKRAFFRNVRVVSDTDTEGVDGRVKRSRSLALGENHSNS